MRGTSISKLPSSQSLAMTSERKVLIQTLRKVIRQDHKIVRQLSRKYQTHQFLEKYREQLKNRIKQLSVYLA